MPPRWPGIRWDGGSMATRSALGGRGPHSRTRPAIGGRSPHSRTPVRPVRPSWARGVWLLPHPIEPVGVRWPPPAIEGAGAPKAIEGAGAPTTRSTKRRTLVRPGPIPLKPRISPPPSISRGLDERSLSVLASKQHVRRDAKPSQWGSKPSSG